MPVSKKHSIPKAPHAQTFPRKKSYIVKHAAAEKVVAPGKKSAALRKPGQKRDIGSRDVRTILDHMQAGILLIDPETHTIVDANTYALDMIGTTSEQVINNVCHRFICPAEKGKCPITDLHQEVNLAERELITSRGERIPILKNVTRLNLQGQSYLLESFIDLTGQKRTEESLRVSEERFRSVTEQANDSIYITDSSGVIQFWNRKSEELYGYTAEEVLGRQHYILMPERVREIHKQWLQRFFNGEIEKTRISGEGIIACKNGTELDVETSIAPLQQEGKKYFVVVNRDITERKEAVALLKKSEEKYRTLVERANDGIIIVQDRMIRFANQRMAELYGSSVEELVGTYFRSLIHHDELPRLIEDFKQRKAGEKLLGYESLFKRCDGNPLSVEISAGVIEYQGRPADLILVRDITRRRQAELELSKSEERLSSIMEQANDAIFIVDNRGIVQFWNRKAVELYGYSEEEILNKPSSLLIPERFRETHATWLKKILADEVKTTGIASEGVNMRKDGSEFYVESSTAILQQGKEKNFVLINRDITERKNAERDLNRLSTAIDQTGEIVVVTDTEGTIQYVNPAFERITGYTKTEAIGQNPRILKSGRHDEKFYRHLWDTLLHGRPWTGQLVNRKKDGSFYDEEATISPVMNSAGVITNYVAVKRDVTENIRMGEQLRQGQKMESIGTLAGGIAHDFNNILAAIIGNAEMALQILPEYSTAHKHLEQVLKSSDRARNLVKQILAFSRKSEDDREPMGMRNTISEVIKMLRSTLPATIEIRENITSDAWIMGSVIQMHQVLLNLCTNAFHAMREQGGVLGIELSDVNIDAENIKLYHALRPGDYVKLSVIDTGTGIAPENMSRIFDPFFTTKVKGEGTGMGLSVVYGIVKSHGGDITVESEPGKGTIFHILLPRIENKSKEQAQTEQPVPLGTERILLVDDEEMIVDIGKKLLEMLGYRVTTALSGTEALDIFQKNPEVFDLVITDYTMPKMTGFELAQQMMAIKPSIPIIMNTGYNETISREKALEAGIREFVLKPLNLRKLGEAVRRVLDGTGATRGPGPVPRDP